MPTYLTMKDLCAFLSISRATAQRMVRDGRLPKPVKLGKSVTSLVRFDRAKVLAAVDAQTSA